MIHRFRRATLALLCTAALAAPAFADDDKISEIPTELEFYKEAGLEPGMQVPGGTNLADFAEESSEPGPRGNETPGQVRSQIHDIVDQKLVNDYLEPKESAGIDKQLAVAKIRLAVAEKRQQRDALRKAHKNREADQLDREIHVLKGKAVAIALPRGKRTLANIFKADDSPAHD